ncbi:MAG TPA: hypothetical protein VJB57_14690 [Dehalococcoidia bacterium]|nr:hypothetical protein [Dehalococcoidia bacterium]
MSAQPKTEGTRDINRIFSSRLDTFLTQILEGETPNSGRFCCFCYTPLPQGQDRCDNCGQDLTERPPVTSIPDDVIEMQRLKHKRESLVVNSFAYLGLGLGLAIFLGMVAINVLYLDKALWFFILATVVLFVGVRLLAGIVGGVIGDEMGYRYANTKLAQDWAAHVSRRETGRNDA